MKRFYTILLVFISISLFGQSTGFKILSSTPTIKSNSDSIQIDLNGKNKYVFKTSEIIRYNYNKAEIKKTEKNVNSIKNDLYENSIDPDEKVRYNEQTIDSKIDELNNIQSNLKTLYKKQDSLYHIYTKNYLQYKRVNILNFGIKKSEAIFDFIYGNSGKKFQVLNNTGFSFGDKSGSIYSELVSGNLGIFRVSLGSMISSSSSIDNETAKVEEAFQRLSTYGGNTVLTLEYPLAYIHSRNNQYNFISRLILKGASDFPAFGTTTDDFAGSGSFGLDFYADASLSNNSLRFFMNFNYNNIYGTDTYKNNLNIQNSTFSFGQLTIGLVIAENIKLSFVIGTFSSETNLENKNVIVGGQILH